MKFNLNALLEQAQKMQQDMEKTKIELSSKTISAESGGGMVKVLMNGTHKLIEIKISKEIVDAEDIEMLEDLVVAAVNIASNSVNKMIEEEIGKTTAKLPKIPGLDLNL